MNPALVQNKFFISLLFLLGAFCLFAANPPLPKWTGFTKIPWAELKDFTHDGSAAALPPPFSAETSVIAASPQSAVKKLRAETLPFQIAGDLIELEVAGINIQHPTVALLGEDESVLADADLQVSLNGTGWTAVRFHTAPGAVGKKASLILRAQRLNGPGWIAVRDRADFYKTAELPVLHLFAVELAIVALIAFWLFFLSSSPPRPAIQFLLYFALAALFQFRLSPYFYWDEWHVLERFSQLGFPGVVYTHNEHFLPLFFAWYFIEARLFADSYAAYLAVSLLLHALNAVLLVKLLNALGEKLPAIGRLAFLFGCLFAANSLQAETLQWSLEQTIILCQLFTFVGILSVLTFLRSGEMRFAVIAGAAALAAPLFFGNGFSLPLQYAVILCFLYFAKRVPVSRAIAVLLLCAVFAGGAAYLYSTHKESTGHGIEQAKPFEHLDKVFEYLEVGTQNGAVLRGLGLFPDLSPNSADKFFKQQGMAVDAPSVFLAHVGIAVSFLCLALGLITPSQRKFSFQLWLAGQGILLSCMILPALGRWELGSAQSLSLRYHYSTLLGVFLIALPALSQFLEWSKNKAVFRVLTPAVIVLAFCTHYFASRHFTYFTKQGSEHRMYVAQLTDWEKRLQAMPAGTTFEASGTELAGLNPMHRATITPGRHPNEIYAVMRWLRRK